jgi:cystathionine beta-lyase
MPFKSLTPLEQVRQRHSSKWRRFAGDVLPMHVAEMDYEIAEGIKQVLVEMVNHSDLGYTGPVPEVAASFEKFALSRWGWQIDPSQVRLATDVGVAAVEILRALGKPGDRVVINSPVYHSFYDWIAEVHMTVEDVPLVRGDETWQLDLEALEAAFAGGAKFYMICSPQNPLGKIFTAAELSSIADLALKHDVTVIADEIHAPLTRAASKFVPYLAVSPAAAETGICITSASKSFNLAGLKSAIIVSQSDAMNERLKALPAAMHWRSALLGAFAQVAAFANGGQWLDEVNEAIEESNQLLNALMDEHLPSVKYWVPEAGYLAWVDVSSLEISDHPAATILAEQKVAFVPGDDHGSAYGKYIRINFACHPESLTRAIKAIAAYAK